jgi:lysozyme
MSVETYGKKLWIQDENGNFEELQPGADYNGRTREPGQADWWVVAKDSDWKPPVGKELPALAGARMKPGGGGELQCYDKYGQYTGTCSGGQLHAENTRGVPKSDAGSGGQKRLPKDLSMSREASEAMSKRPYEGYSPVPYHNDGSKGGKCTVGYGHKLHDGHCTSEDIKKWYGKTEQDFKNIYMEDVHIAEDDVRNLIKVPVTQGQFDALTSLAYNKGRKKFNATGIPGLVNEGKTEQAAQAILDLNKTGGLAKRRKWEYGVFTGTKPR